MANFLTVEDSLQLAAGIFNVPENLEKKAQSYIDRLLWKRVMLTLTHSG
jgi:hypothetical protein